MRIATSRSRLGVGALAGLVLLALLAGCGGGAQGGPDEPAGAPSAAADVTGGVKLMSTWPMTGLPVTGADTAAQQHPVLVLKMDNTAASAPQLGLGSADLVIEELVEGGLTRLAAFFYSDVPGTVGPVRSMRASDIGIVSPVGASVVTSGAAGVTIDRINRAGIPFFQEGAKGFFRDYSRHSPYNLFTDLAETATLTRRADERPADYLPWGAEEDFVGGRPATQLGARFSTNGHTTSWAYRSDRYTNLNTYAAGGDEFSADTVLVLRVEVTDAGYLDPAGNFVPETKFTGGGEAMIFHRGRVVRGRWAKARPGAPLTLTTPQGKGALTVPAGHTWIELVPEVGGSVSYTP